MRIWGSSSIKCPPLSFSELAPSPNIPSLPLSSSFFKYGRKTPFQIPGWSGEWVGWLAWRSNCYLIVQEIQNNLSWFLFFSFLLSFSFPPLFALLCFAIAVGKERRPRSRGDGGNVRVVSSIRSPGRSDFFSVRKMQEAKAGMRSKLQPLLFHISELRSWKSSTIFTIY